MDNPAGWLNAVVLNRVELIPLPTEQPAALKPIDGIRAVVFDIYGTLVISGSGDVGSANRQDQGQHMQQAFLALGIKPDQRELPKIQQLHEQIQLTNQKSRSADCPQPEVDIIAIWQQTLAENGWRDLADDVAAVVRLSAEYESRANPTWPMPGAKELLFQLSQGPFQLGIVSNAQAFTLRLVDDLTDFSGMMESATKTDPSSIFQADLSVYSYRFGHAKPGPRLFQVLVDGLTRRGIMPQEAIYVGNDCLNDVWAASRAGLRTAWFAGDRRSMRRRSEDPRCAAIEPDLILTQLNQLLDCLSIP